MLTTDGAGLDCVVVELTNVRVSEHAAVPFVCRWILEALGIRFRVTNDGVFQLHDV